MKPSIHVLPALKDNYIFLIETVHGYLMVDTPQVEPILPFLRKKPLLAILNTHHHWDHSGHNLELRSLSNCKVLGFQDDAYRLPGITQTVEDGEEILLEGIRLQVLATPGHTVGHIAWYAPDLNSLFVGDTLFRGGCGRLFEGSAEQMFASLQRLRQLPESTRIYCAHEYTLNNLKFAASYQPQNRAVKREYQSLQTLETPHRTIPTTLGRELQTNIFLMARSVEEFRQMRAAKDAF